jgi:pimeloyl-ACP methyl ester carboxylesterase
MKTRRFQTGPRGLNLQLYEWGAGDPVTVILHGYLEQGAAWNPIARHLDGRILAPDHRGHARSDHVGPGGFYHFFDYVADIDALVESLGGPVRIIGHSMGGTIASYYAGARPEMVSSLVLIEGLGPPDRSSDPVAVARKHLRDRRDPKQHSVIRDVAEAVQRLQRVNPALTDETGAELAANLLTTAPTGALQWAWDPLHRARNAIGFSAANFKGFLSEITAPTLVIRGGTSTFVVQDYADRIKSLPKATEAVIPGAGHLVHHDQPDALAAVIVSFFQQHP